MAPLVVDHIPSEGEEGFGCIDPPFLLALTEHGRVIHEVVDDGSVRTDTDMIGKRARCGQRVIRFVHPADHLAGDALCRRCVAGPKEGRS